MNRLLLGLAFAWSTLCVSEASAQDASELDLESLLNVEVSSASKFSQRIADAPSAVTVITGDDIRRMGAADLGDALRMVPGLNLRMKSRGSYSISSRNDFLATTPKMLILVDGRATMNEVHSITVWESLELTLEQIDRIEVVRGPGSALYGANAYDGVVNIITRRPSGGVQVAASGEVGEFERRNASVLYQQTRGALRADGFFESRASGVETPLREISRTGVTTHDRAEDFLKGGLRFGWSNPQGTDVEVSAGASRGDALGLWSISRDNFEMDNHANTYVMATVRRPDLVGGAALTARVYQNWRRVQGRMFDDLRTTTQDAEVMVDGAAGTHRLVVGANAKRYWQGAAATFLPVEHDQLLLAAFAQDSWAITPKWDLVAGLRYDHHPHTGHNLSPRAALLFKPAMLHTFRASAGRAFRNPTLMENYIDLDFKYQVKLTDTYTTIRDGTVNGNLALDPEVITSYELGYIGSLHPTVTLSLDLFRNRHEARMDVERIAADTVYFGPMPAVFPREWQYFNEGSSTARGGEAAMVWAPKAWFRTSANYGYTDFLRDDAEEGRQGFDATPRHKLNAEVAVRPLSGLWLDLTYHQSSAVDHYWYITEGAEKDFGSSITEEIRTVNLHARADLWRGLGASLYVQNLFDREYQDFVGAETFGRRAIAKVSYTF